MNTAKIFEKTLLEDVDIESHDDNKKDSGISLYESFYRVALDTGIQTMRIYKQIAKCDIKK